MVQVCYVQAHEYPVPVIFVFPSCSHHIHSVFSTPYVQLNLFQDIIPENNTWTIDGNMKKSNKKVPIHGYIPQAVLNLFLIYAHICCKKSSSQKQVGKEIFSEVKWTLERNIFQNNVPTIWKQWLLSRKKTILSTHSTISSYIKVLGDHPIFLF